MTYFVQDFIKDNNLSLCFDTKFYSNHCYFDDSVYNPDLYKLFNIDFPDTIRKSVIKRQAEFLAGRHCARNVLKNINNNLAEYVVKNGIDRAPKWPRNLKGSISHCNGQAIAIACSDQSITGLGVDIEEIINQEMMSQIINQVINQDESYLIERDNAEKTLIFTIIFSVKESFFKAAYSIVKQYFDFSAIIVTKINHAQSSVEFIIDKPLHTTLPTGKVLNANFHILPDNKVITFVVI